MFLILWNSNFDYHWLLVSLFSLPILLWFIVLACATLAITTKTYTVHPEEPEDAMRVFFEQGIELKR